MKRFLILGVLISFLLGGIFYFTNNSVQRNQPKQQAAYWFILQRKSNKEFLYKGMPGSKEKSQLVKTFVVKAGIPGQRPTPLPKLLGKEYWVIVAKQSSKDNPETAPYFLTLNIPAPSEEPYGPAPYKECNGQQCDWILPGAFGLHGVNGDETRLAKQNSGSSGCVRHKDADITYLYNVLDPKRDEIRYYIEDI